jgi:rod shape-determining protein MreD
VTFIKYFFLFVLILMAQIFVFDPISKMVIVRPFIFLYAILILPPMQGWLYLLLAMAMGLVYDVFFLSPGIHAAAAVLLAYVRNPLIRAFKDDEPDFYSPHITYLGLGRFFFFTLIISLGFHTLVELLSVFNFKDFLTTLERIVINTLASAVLMYLLDIILFYRGKATE